jgi:hypothetical protein
MISPLAGGPEESNSEQSVRGRYLVGMLAPRGSNGIPNVGEATVFSLHGGFSAGSACGTWVNMRVCTSRKEL